MLMSCWLTLSMQLCCACLLSLHLVSMQLCADAPLWGLRQLVCCAARRANPYGRNGQDQWSLHTGQDFLPNHMVDGIDYASLHLWPDNWARTDLYFGRCCFLLTLQNVPFLLTGCAVVLLRYQQGLFTLTGRNVLVDPCWVTLQPNQGQSIERSMTCRRWLDAHLVDQWYLGKPVVIEEFGKAIGGFHTHLHGSFLQIPTANG